MGQILYAAEDGFDMRGPVGNLWARALKADSDLKKQYTDIGSSSTMQRDFRTGWASREFKAI